MICGHCKTQNTSVAHVRACSQRRSEPSPVATPQPAPMDDLTEKSMWQLPNRSARIGWDIYRVFIGADSGKPYVKVRTESGWSYVPGGVRTLREHGTRLTPEVAKAFGDVYVTCCICGRDLTNPESIEYGIGPVCRAKMGW